MSTLEPTTYYHHKVSVWCHLLEGARMLNDDTIRLVGRLGLSFFILYLVFIGRMPSVVGATTATIISGIDVAAFIEAVKIVQSTDTSESTPSE